MKKYLFFIATACCLIGSFISCKREASVEPSNYEAGPPAILTIIKFDNSELLNKVIVQHPIKDNNSNMEYDEHMGLFLNVLQPPYKHSSSKSPDLVNWADEEMHIAGSSPYIPLKDKYYLIDWRWHQIFPLSAFANAWDEIYSNHVSKHCFTTDVNWTEIKDLTMGFDASIDTHPVEGIEIIRIEVYDLAALYQKDSDPYICWNFSIYYGDGMCLDNAWMYYIYGDCSSLGRTHHTYIEYCDSVQTLYQQRLIDLIDKGQLKELESK